MTADQQYAIAEANALREPEYEEDDQLYWHLGDPRCPRGRYEPEEEREEYEPTDEECDEAANCHFGR